MIMNVFLYVTRKRVSVISNTKKIKNVKYQFRVWGKWDLGWGLQGKMKFSETSGHWCCYFIIDKSRKAEFGYKIRIGNIGKSWLNRKCIVLMKINPDESHEVKLACDTRVIKSVLLFFFLALLKISQFCRHSPVAN